MMGAFIIIIVITVSVIEVVVTTVEIIWYWNSLVSLLKCVH